MTSFIQIWEELRYDDISLLIIVFQQILICHQMHIWCLAQCLIERGHKVVVVTHSYNDRKGIRYMTNGLKVYYIPLNVVYDQVIYPTFYSFFPLFRNILYRERIDILHAHQSSSPLANECLLYARTLGYKTCLTDHSLFGFADLFR